jgi:hypothetical protein
MIAGCSFEEKIVDHQQIEIEEEKIFELCETLSSDKKAQLVKRLLADQSIQVVFGNSQMHADTIYQINLSDREQMADILKAIASRISKEPS